MHESRSRQNPIQFRFKYIAEWNQREREEKKSSNNALFNPFHVLRNGISFESVLFSRDKRTTHQNIDIFRQIYVNSVQEEQQ